MKRTELRRKTPWRWKPKPREDNRGCSSTVEQPSSKRRSAGSTPVNSIKPSRPKSTPTRKAASGEPCLIRLPGCGGADGTVVLAHYRLLPYCGTGLKPPDELGAFGCANCHDIVDGRKPPPFGWTLPDIRLAHAEGVMRTQLRLKDLQSSR